MGDILTNTDEVVNYNNFIMENIDQLSASTEELSACMEEAINLYEDNKVKTKETKNVMDKLEVAIEQLII